MEEPKIGVYICWCGSNIAKIVDVEAISAEIGNMPNISVSRDYKYMCSDPGQEIIVNDIKKHNLNRIVVSACSPRIHELTFRKAIENAGLNPYLFEMANIREQVSWVHTDRKMATEKAKALILAAINKVTYNEELEKRSADVNPATLIIGGGISGMTAALDIAESGYKVYLIEREKKLGGIVSKIDLTFPHLSSAQQLIKSTENKICNNENIEIFLNTQIKQVEGFIGNFETIINKEDSQ
ncbi:MAG: FAD-dependent oxidoreductase, partial [Bacteroidota bacterium]